MKVNLFIYSNTIWQHVNKKKTKKKPKMTVGNIAQNTKDITVNWNMPFDTETGGGKQNKILLRRI